MPSHLNTELFKEKAINKHGEKYDYSQTIFTTGKQKIKIICKQHGEFIQQADAHIRQGQGCPTCGKNKQVSKRTKTLEQFISDSIKIHADKYDYSKSVYINDNSKIIIICSEHGEFEQKVSNHLQGKGCNKCADIIRASKKAKPFEKFIDDAKKVHNEKYSYENVIYKNSTSKILVTCKNHGDFKITPSNLLKGKGCPLCVNKGEMKIFENLKLVYPSIEYNKKFEWCKNKRHLPYDFVILDQKIIIELDGCQHFKQVSNWSNPNNQFINDKYKEKCANENGYSTIRLLQKDVFFDNYNWLKELLDTIDIIKTSNIVKNYYLCKNNEYINYN